MEWHPTDAHSLAIIDQEVGDHTLSPAEYEIVRRAIYATADFDFKSLIHFSDLALQSGAAALAARTTIVVDIPMVQVGINTNIQNTFVNPIYCSMEAFTRPQKEKTRSAWGMETLAKRYPEGIFVIGQSQTALITLATLIHKEEIKPTLVIATPSGFLDIDSAKAVLNKARIPNIYTQGRKGNAVVASAIVNGLVDLSWKAYGGDN